MSDESKPNLPQKGPATTLRVLLIGSLMLNLALVGIGAGRLIAQHGPGHGPRPMQVNLPDFGGALDRDDRAAVGQRLTSRAAEIYRNLPDRAAGIAAFDAAIRAEPFDRAALEALFAQQREVNEQMMEAAQGALLDRLETMGPQARLRFADRFRAQIFGQPGERGGD